MMSGGKDKEPESSSGSSEEGEDDSFLRQEKVLEEEERRSRGSVQSPPFDLGDSWDNNRDSFVTALENPGDLASPPPDDEGDGDGGAGGAMSTIEEESRSYETSTGASASASRRGHGQDGGREEEAQQDFDESQELREIQKLVDETSAELNQDQAPKSMRTSAKADPAVPSGSSNPHNNPPSHSNEEDEGLEALLRKLEKLESAQNVLEDVLNTGVSENIDIDAFIAQLPLDPSQLIGGSGRGIGEDDHDHSQRSFSSEIASIQKIIDGADLSLSMNSEVAGGNNDLLSPEDTANPSQEINSRGRSVEDVLKEYEELERSISCGSVMDESFRSDISSVPPLSTYSSQAADKIVPTATASFPSAVTVPAHSNPVIKPPVLKTVVPPPPASTNLTQMSSGNSNITREYYYSGSTKEPSYHHEQDREGSSSRTRPMTSNPAIKPTGGSRSSRIESSQSAHGIKPQPVAITQSARTAFSATTTSAKDNNNQDAFKPRNRRMRSPRTVVSPRQPHDKFVSADIPTSSSARGGGDGEGLQQVLKKNNKSKSQQKSSQSVQNVETVVAAEALKTIEKLNTMVARQETLLGAYSKDNEKLWDQLREAKNESQEKEVNFQDVINSLKTEVATLKLNRLVTAPPVHNIPSTNASNKVELQRLREESDLKSQQLLEFRKEVLHLQSKLAARQTRSPSRTKQSATAHLISDREEKEKVYQKSITLLNKQVRTLQRILYSKEETAPPPPPPSSEGNKLKPMQRTQSDVGRRQTQNSAGNTKQVQQQPRTSLRNTGVGTTQVFGKKSRASPVKAVNINTGEVLQASLNCLGQEREEFESIIADKNKLIFEKEKLIMNLKEKVETLKSQLPDGDVVEPGLIDELRSRIITQNKVIQTLKEHLSTFKKIEAENMLLREERSTFEHQARDLRRRLEFAQSLVKPENEVLCLLSEKVDELNSRYYQRERQLDTLLSRLTVKTTAGGGGVMSSSSSNDSADGAAGRLHSSNLSPRRRLPLGQFSNNNGSLGGALLTSSIGGKGRSSALISADILHMVDLSPTNSFQLFDTDLP